MRAEKAHKIAVSVSTDDLLKDIFESIERLSKMARREFHGWYKKEHIVGITNKLVSLGYTVDTIDTGDDVKLKIYW